MAAAPVVFNLQYRSGKAKFPGKGSDSMPIPDKFVAITSSLWQVRALPAVLALLLSGCGSSQSPARPDAGAAPAPGPEAGPEAAVFPTDPESCARSTILSECLFGRAGATISSAAGGPLLAKIAVTDGPCSADSCASECASIVVYSAANVGSTCDLEVTATDGRSQSVRLTVVRNPAPHYTCCCGSSPSSCQWAVLDPTTFSPNFVVVDFAPLDASAPIVDSSSLDMNRAE